MSVAIGVLGGAPAARSTGGLPSHRRFGLTAGPLSCDNGTGRASDDFNCGTATCVLRGALGADLLIQLLRFEPTAPELHLEDP